MRLLYGFGKGINLTPATAEAVYFIEHGRGSVPILQSTPDHWYTSRKSLCAESGHRIAAKGARGRAGVQGGLRKGNGFTKSINANGSVFS